MKICHVNSFFTPIPSNLDKYMDNTATKHGVVLSISYISEIGRDLLALSTLWHQFSTTTYSRVL